jgi:transposase InsO family protein
VNNRDLVIHRKKTDRLYKAEELALRRRRRQRLPKRERLRLVVPQRRNQRWSMDFASGASSTGRRFRCLCLVDDATRESPALLPDFAIAGERVVRLLDAFACRLVGRRRSSWTTVRSAPAGRSMPGRHRPGCGGASSSPASRSRTLSWKASSAGSGTNV